MTVSQKLWVGWCAAWALFWATLGWIIFPIGNVLLFVFSLLVAAPAFRKVE